MVNMYLFRDPERTASVLDSEGWLHTGDVGEWLPSGTLKIIDHKKTIFKLSRGEYVAPDKVEEIYKRSPYIAQVGIHGSAEWPEFVIAARRGNSATDDTYGHVGTRKHENQKYMMKDC